MLLDEEGGMLSMPTRRLSQNKPNKAVRDAFVGN